MRVISFPRNRAGGADGAWAAELDAALDGDGEGAIAESWRELRADVRSLAPPLDPALEQRLRVEIDRRTARRRGRPATARGHLRSGSGTIGAAAVALAAVAVALVIALPGAHDASPRVAHAFAPNARLAPAVGAPAKVERAGSAPAAPSSQPASAAVAVPEVASSGAGRVQQQAATLRLSSEPSQVQPVADQIAQLAARDGGFVQSSHVQVEAHGQSEAVLTLSLPSARLAPALAAIARLAPVRSETQSLQDITSSYEAARRRLRDARAERAALLRALANATTPGQIASLRERLAQSRNQLAAAQAHLHAVSQRASNSEVEVAVAGTAGAQGGGLTVGRGLHDAGRVLTAALAVLLIALAVLLPLALLGALFAVAGRASRRYRRERALEDS